MDIRIETPADIAGIRGVEEDAFPTPSEADLVDRLLDRWRRGIFARCCPRGSDRKTCHVFKDAHTTGDPWIGSGSGVDAAPAKRHRRRPHS